jgi:peptide/nickel transport system substrate-binding protein
MRAGLPATRLARMRSGGHRRGGIVGACCAAVGLVLLLAACGPAAGSASGGAPASSSGGTSATFAMQPGGIAQYPFPFMGTNQLGFDSVFNIDEFQYMLYRPLYWFGDGTKPYMNPQLSLAYPPVYSRNEVKIKLKRNYKWSDGEAVDAQDVVFWMNMMAAEGPNDAYFSNSGLPSDVTSVHAVGRYEVTMRITTPFSQSWFSSNELSEITPMPLAWDVTSSTAKPGAGGCSSASYSSIRINASTITVKNPAPTPLSASAKACNAVFNYLTAQASPSNPTPTTFANSSIWSVVDGPWKLASLTTAGNLKLTFNSKYGGPVAPHHITTFTELPFTSEQAEYNVLQDPTAGQTIDVGYLPTVDAPTPPAGALVGANPSTLPNYQLSAQYLWQLSYMPYNFRNTTGQAPIFDQLYFRQAFQMLVDQEGVINGPLHGYGKPTIGPVTLFPKTTYLSQKVVDQGDPWALNIQGAASKLRANGWTERGKPATFTCTRPGTGKGDCGAGIPGGRQLSFTMMYASGIDWMQSAARELASNASLAGIRLTLQPNSFNNVVDAAFGLDPACSASSCRWQLALWGSWTYSPDYLPTGDTLFEGGAGNNAGDYNVPQDNQLITDTLHARTPGQFDAAMHTWDYYATNQLPVVYEPDQATLVETIKGLDIGVQNSAGTMTPEDWHYLK